MITIFINDKIFNISKDLSLFEVLKNNFSSNLEGIAVAVNNNVIPRSQWNSTFLNNNDHILIIKATMGG